MGYGDKEIIGEISRCLWVLGRIDTFKSAFLNDLQYMHVATIVNQITIFVVREHYLSFPFCLLPSVSCCLQKPDSNVVNDSQKPCEILLDFTIWTTFFFKCKICQLFGSISGEKIFKFKISCLIGQDFS